MLKGIDHRLNAEVLGCLRGMGHGDKVILTDVNFPAESLARQSVLGKLLRMENLTLPAAMDAVLSVLPLDTFVDDFAATMQVVGAPDQVLPVHIEMQAAIDRAEGRPRPMQRVDRFGFYDLTKGAFAVIQTGERRLYGNIMLRKGIIRPEEQ